NWQTGAAENVVQGNLIGTDAAGADALGNGSFGVWIRDASNNTVGGTAPGARNVIAFNGDGGVAVYRGSDGDAILSNRIHDNAGLGIALADDGATPDDSGDGDSGPNGLQNFAVLTSVVDGNSTFTIRGTLNSTPGTSFRVEFFSVATADPSGYGEGDQ